MKNFFFTFINCITVSFISILFPGNNVYKVSSPDKLTSVEIGIEKGTRLKYRMIKNNKNFPIDIKAKGGQALVIYQDTKTGRSAGLPIPWKQQDIGAVAIAGHTDYDGKQFIIEASGNATDSTKDELQFAYFPLETEGEITARVVPQPGSQFSKTGLMMRETLAANSVQASLILNLRKSYQVEDPRWQSLLVTRGATGKPVQVKVTGPILTEPLEINGRFTGEYWLRLQRKFNSFTAFTSADGKTWTSLGSTFVEMKKSFFAGIAVSSGLKKVKTRIMFDNISIPGWRSGE